MATAAERRGLALAAALAAGLLAAGLPAAPALAGAGAGEGEGWYYPPPQHSERYEPKTIPAADSDRERRITFVTNVVNFLLSRPFAPRYLFITAGAQDRELIVIETSGDFPDTIHFARAALEAMSSVVRATAFARDLGLQYELTFLDLAYFLGFESVVFTNADDFAYRVDLAP